MVERPWNGPTSVWKPNELAPALLDIPLPGSMKPRTLHLSVTAYDASNPTVELGSAQLADSGMVATPEQPYHAVWANFGNTMAIRGYQTDRPEVIDGVHMRTGQSIIVTLDLLSLRVMGSGDNQTAFVHMLDGQGKLEAQHDELAGGSAHPTSRWVGGEPVRQRFAMTLPPDAPPGAYRFEAGFYQLATLQRLPLLDIRGQQQGDSLVFGNIVVANAP